MAVSTVSRKKKRNSNSKGVYDAHLTVLRTKRRKAEAPGNRSIEPHVRSRVFQLIRDEQWSPEQVSGAGEGGGTRFEVNDLQLDIDRPIALQGQHTQASQVRHVQETPRRQGNGHVHNQQSVHRGKTGMGEWARARGLGDGHHRGK